MDLGTLALVPLVAGAAAAPSWSVPAGTGGPAGEGALGAYLAGADAADLYVELFDLGRLEHDFSSSGLGRLGQLFLPRLEGRIPPGVLEDLDAELGLDPAALVRGQVSWEDALSRALYTLAREHLGLGRDEALGAVAALGTRFSVAFDPHGERAACSWSLREGGQEVLSELLAARGAAAGVRLLATGEDGSGQLFGLTLEGGQEVFAALRPDLVALCSEVGWGRLLAGAQGRAEASDFDLARERALQSGASLWGWLDGELLTGPCGDEGGRAVSAALGLDGVRAMELALASEGGQLTSRLRIGLPDGERRGLFSLVQGGRAPWEGLERLTADTFAVVGIARAPADLAGELVELIARVPGAPDVRELWAEMRRAPLLAELLTPGAGGDETLLFLRAGAAGLPMSYAVLPAGAEVVERLARLREGMPGMQGGAGLRIKELDGNTCWLLGKGASGLAVTHADGALIASQSFLALQDYLRQRAREDGDRRAQLVADLRAALGRPRGTSGPPSSNLAAFAHVRTEPLFEAAWPWVLMALSMTGAEGLEDLPDAFEIAEEIGDTTLLLFDDGEALELHGRGLLAGLGVVF